MSSITSPTTTALVPFYPEQNALYRARLWLEKRQDSSVTVPLSGDVYELFDETLIPLQRYIEKLYVDLPWPRQMQTVIVFTEIIEDGLGDIAAAAKAISLMLRIVPTNTSFEWVTYVKAIGFSSPKKKYEPLSFLTLKERARVQHSMFSWSFKDKKKDPADFVLVGPVVSMRKEHIETIIGRKINGPIYGFKEIADRYGEKFPISSYPSFRSYSAIFPINYEPDTPRLTGTCQSMGIIPGRGVFLDEGRVQAVRSRGYCCPTYLHKIQDTSLLKDILESMQIYDDKSVPNFDKYSFNSGYARWLDSHKRFIYAVAMHERAKHVVIVLNECKTMDAFFDHIFTLEAMAVLQQNGYGSITVKSLDREKVFLLGEDSPGHRDLTVIIRPGFSPQDMRSLQLSSERLLATGDNTAVESWCALCILFLYECPSHKQGFRKQQIDLAKKIAPSLARLLELPLPSYSANVSIKDLETAVCHPDLAQDTLRFCTYISERCSFAPIFEAAIKRTAWRFLNPDLIEVEAEALGTELPRDLMNYMKDRRTVQSLTLHNLPHLKNRIRKSTEEYLERPPIEFIQKIIEQYLEDSCISEHEIDTVAIPSVQSVKPISYLSQILTKVEDFFSDFGYRCFAYKYGLD